MSYAEKASLFLGGRYQLATQPLGSAGWGLDEWIRYVDWFGRWESSVAGTGGRVPSGHGVRLRLRMVC
jgi:hypothetical protein